MAKLSITANYMTAAIFSIVNRAGCILIEHLEAFQDKVEVIRFSANPNYNIVSVNVVFRESSDAGSTKFVVDLEYKYSDILGHMFLGKIKKDVVMGIATKIHELAVAFRLRSRKLNGQSRSLLATV